MHLATIQSITGNLLYSTFVSIGSVAELHIYEKQEHGISLGILNYTLTLIDESRKSIEASKKDTTIGLEYSTFLAGAYEALGYMKKQAESYVLYVNTGNKDYIQEFEKARTSAWTKISELLGI
ncbi:hypothetical protein [Leptospira ilyithenensis]|uniref:Uncharacterized protein n=1 Tax=Leptospira ilyithenensis TaxID=2484901 RepID=A0A4V3JX05_9LEPT|nr:hypothetical protein [Leptospira ilyithenensis]TGN10101.1 hypothetical protein EHS11_11110 [Leptospira ilyithenensis]